MCRTLCSFYKNTILIRKNSLGEPKVKRMLRLKKLEDTIKITVLRREIVLPHVQFDFLIKKMHSVIADTQK